MIDDFLINLLASIAYDLLKALLPRSPREEDIWRELQSELRRQSEALQALQAVLTCFGGQRVVNVGGGVNTIIIITGDGNEVTVNDRGQLAQRWQELQLSDAEATVLYRERIANLYAHLTFPLSGIFFDTLLHEVYQPLQAAPVQDLANWHLAERVAPERQRETNELLEESQPVALLGLLGGGKTTTLHYLTWAYACRLDDRLLWRGDELLPFYLTARDLAATWRDGVHPRLRSWCDAVAASSERGEGLVRCQRPGACSVQRGGQIP